MQEVKKLIPRYVYLFIKILQVVDIYLDHTHKQLINMEFLRFPSERAA